MPRPALVLAALAAGLAGWPASAQTRQPAQGGIDQPTRATTADGRTTVLLHPDGTWTVEEVHLDLTAPPPPAPPPPAPPPGSAYPPSLSRVLPPVPSLPGPPLPAPPQTVESASGAYSVRYDASRWRPSSTVLNAQSEFEYVLPLGAGYAVTIFEVTPFDLKTMKEVSLQAPRINLGAEVTLVSEETVELGATDGLRLEYRVAPPTGPEVTFINTMHSDDQGTLQVITWTSTAVLPRFRDELLRFHDGLRIMKPGHK